MPEKPMEFGSIKIVNGVIIIKNLESGQWFQIMVDDAGNIFGQEYTE